MPGRVLRISGVEGVIGRSEIAMCELRVKEGDIINQIDSHPARAGVIIAVGDTRHDAIIKAESAISDISIETIPFNS